MELAIQRTRDIFEEKITDPLGQTIEEAPLSVVEVTPVWCGRFAA